MLHKTLVAAFVVASGDALRIDGLSNRRAVVGTAASALSLVPLAAFAEPEELKKASDAEIYARADEGSLISARVVERAKAGRLVDGSGASLNELSRIISVDKKAIKLERERIEALGGLASMQDKKKLEASEKIIEAQVMRLENVRRQKRLEKDD
jgi:hypothetical protein